jgi:hypothetical protein
MPTLVSTLNPNVLPLSPPGITSPTRVFRHHFLYNSKTTNGSSCCIVSTFKVSKSIEIYRSKIYGLNVLFGR